MINILFSSQDKDKSLYIEISGHSKSAPMGQDLICASASILTYTLAQIISTAERHDELVNKPIISISPGNTIISCQCKDIKSYYEISHSMMTIKVGFLLLEQSYPQFVTVKTLIKP